MPILRACLHSRAMAAECLLSCIVWNGIAAFQHTSPQNVVYLEHLASLGETCQIEALLEESMHVGSKMGSLVGAWCFLPVTVVPVQFYWTFHHIHLE